MVPPLAKQESRSQCEECAADRDEGALTRDAQGDERNADDEKWNSRPSFHIILPHFFGASNGRAFSGEPSRQRERAERMRGRRVRCKDEMDSSRDVSGIMVPASFGVLA
jgi:hypothetical protein